MAEFDIAYDIPWSPFSPPSIDDPNDEIETPRDSTISNSSLVDCEENDISYEILGIEKPFDIISGEYDDDVLFKDSMEYHGTDINNINDYGRTMLRHCITYNKPIILKYLISEGADFRIDVNLDELITFLKVSFANDPVGLRESAEKLRDNFRNMKW